MMGRERVGLLSEIPTSFPPLPLFLPVSSSTRVRGSSGSVLPSRGESRVRATCPGYQTPIPRTGPYIFSVNTKVGGGGGGEEGAHDA